MNFHWGKPIIGFVLIFLMLFSLTSLAFFLNGCTLERGQLIDIKIHNQTDEGLEIFISDEVSVGKISPGGVVVWETVRAYSTNKITVKDTDGNIVYVVTWTGDDLKGKEAYDVYLPPEEDSTTENISIE